MEKYQNVYYRDVEETDGFLICHQRAAGSTLATGSTRGASPHVLHHTCFTTHVLHIALGGVLDYIYVNVYVWFTRKKVRRKQTERIHFSMFATDGRAGVVLCKNLRELVLD